MNGINYFLLHLKDKIIESSCWLLGGSKNIGNSITASRVEVGFKKVYNCLLLLAISADLLITHSYRCWYQVL